MQPVLNTVTIRVTDGGIARLECHNSLPDTASVAREYARAGYPDRYVVFSDQRTSVSEEKRKTRTKDNGVFMSLILRPSLFTSEATLIGHLATVAFVSALEEYTSGELGIGWVNEVFCDGTRIGNVTVEGRFDGGFKYEYIIISFRATLDEEHFPPRLTDMIKKVFESENTSISMIIAKTVLNKFFQLFANIKNAQKYMTVYANKFIQRSHTVKYIEDGKKKSGKILGINPENGALVIDNKRQGIVNLGAKHRIVVPTRRKK